MIAVVQFVIGVLVGLMVAKIISRRARDVEAPR
jgi:uncharacterized membrane-anchored protein YhcB (DUF1043 family)